MKSDIPALLARIAAEDAAIGAFWQLVEAPTGEGLAIGIKDNVDVAGLRTTAGIAGFRDRVAATDAPLVTALRASGAVILGKLAMDEGAFGAVTAGCMNPLRAGFTPGGSSGGSGAAVAAGFVPLAVGTDTMGSVRIPAAYCGVVGLKPTAGLIGRTGIVPLSPSLDCAGMLAQTPRLAALGIEAMIADDPADPASRPPPPGWRAVPEMPLDFSELRIGLPEPVLAAPMEPAIRAAWDAAAARLRSLGAEVQPIPMPGWIPGEARRAGLLVIEAEAAAAHPALIDDPDAASAGFRAAMAYGRDCGTARLVRAYQKLAVARAAALRALDECDVLLMPTCPQRAFAHGTPAPADQADFCALANIAGLPALSVPWPATDGGLPCSVQFVGRPYSEALLVALA